MPVYLIAEEMRPGHSIDLFDRDIALLVWRGMCSDRNTEKRIDKIEKMSTKPSGKIYRAGIEEYRSAYGCFKITPQAGVDREEADAAAPFLHRHRLGVST